MRSSNTASYAELKQLVEREGLLDKQPIYYTHKILVIPMMLAVSTAVLILVSNPWLQMLNAVFLAFAFVQTGLIMHDANHLQIFKAVWKNRLCGLVSANLILGTSSGWWEKKHNKHHANPNHVDLDPDANLPILAFSEKQALSMEGIARFIGKYQAHLWFPMISLYAFHWRIYNFRILLGNLTGREKEYTVRNPLVEMIFLIASDALYIGAIFFFLGVWQALIFITVHHVLVGLYMASIFATNHKGMPLIEGKTDFLHMQTITARNVKGGALTDFFMGGLNYQIEHHLFSAMPRNNLRKAQKIVKAYCAKHGISYYETGFLHSYKEILQNFYTVSAVLRNRPVTPV